MDKKEKDQLEAELKVLLEKRDKAQGIPERRLLWAQMKPILAKLGKKPGEA